MGLLSWEESMCPRIQYSLCHLSVAVFCNEKMGLLPLLTGGFAPPEKLSPLNECAGPFWGWICCFCVQALANIAGYGFKWVDSLFSL